MNSLPARIVFVFVCSIALLAAAFVLFTAPYARADVGVIPIVPAGSNLYTQEETPVKMLAETVTITLRQPTDIDRDVLGLYPQDIEWSSDWLPAVADVTADFAMLNPTQEAISMTVWFPLSANLEDVSVWVSVGRFQVSAGGQNLAVATTELPNPNGAELPDLPWASFPVTFPPAQALLIRVSYTLPPQLIPGDMIGMDFSYIFQTGAGWAGPIERAELIVNLPYPATTETVGSMPANAQVQGNTLRWSWQNLEPEPQDDFRIHLLQPTHWNDLVQRQAAAQLDAQNGRAWQALADVYRRLVHTRGPGFSRDFGPVYQPLAVQAYQEALRLLPEEPILRVRLAELYLAPLFARQQATPEELGKVEEELLQAEQLLVSQPDDAASSEIEQVRFWIGLLQEQFATQTAQAAITNTAQPSSTPSASETPTPIPATATVATLPPTVVPAAPSTWNSPLFLLAGVMVLLAGVVLLFAWWWLRRSSS